MITVKWLKAYHTEEAIYLYWIFQKGKTEANGWSLQREGLQHQIKRQYAEKCEAIKVKLIRYWRLAALR